jgi:CheY-like chemotaxis protein
MEDINPSATILLVDDDDPLRRLVQDLLRAEGFHVIDASNGVEALEISSAYPQPIDLLLTDVIMPKVNGLLLAGRLLQERPSIAVLYMSGYVEQSILAAKHPEAVLIRKPFTPGALIAAVRQVLGSR